MNAKLSQLSDSNKRLLFDHFYQVELPQNAKKYYEAICNAQIKIDKQNATIDYFDRKEKKRYRYYPIRTPSNELIALDAIPWKKGFVFNLAL